MYTTCSPTSCSPASTTAAPESLRKPLYNVNGGPDAYEVRVEMPGVPKSGIKLDLEENLLTVRGERGATVPEGMKALHRELSPLNYLLRLRLNTPVDEEKMTAQLTDGVLTIRLPLQAVAKPRQITVM